MSGPRPKSTDGDPAHRGRPRPGLRGPARSGEWRPGRIVPAPAPHQPYEKGSLRAVGRGGPAVTARPSRLRVRRGRWAVMAKSAGMRVSPPGALGALCPVDSTLRCCPVAPGCAGGAGCGGIGRGDRRGRFRRPDPAPPHRPSHHAGRSTGRGGGGRPRRLALPPRRQARQSHRAQHHPAPSKATRAGHHSQSPHPQRHRMIIRIAPGKRQTHPE